jgi:DNA-binding NarL/FixJ family response regulator
MRLGPPEEPAGDPIEEKKGTVRVVIADDHPIVRDGLKWLLSLEDDFEIVGEAGDGREAIEKVKETDPDVLLLDLQMPNLSGLRTLEILQRSNCRTRVIVLTASENEDEFVQAVKLGCRGILLKQDDSDLIVRCIRKVHVGEVWLDNHTMTMVMKQFSNGLRSNQSDEVADSRSGKPLSAREREIVALIAQGYKNREMAEKLVISEQTVKNHLHNIFDKLGVSDRLELALCAIQKGLHLNESLPARKPQSPVPAALGTARDVDPQEQRFFLGRRT